MYSNLFFLHSLLVNIGLSTWNFVVLTVWCMNCLGRSIVQGLVWLAWFIIWFGQCGWWYGFDRCGSLFDVVSVVHGWVWSVWFMVWFGRCGSWFGCRCLWFMDLFGRWVHGLVAAVCALWFGLLVEFMICFGHCGPRFGLDGVVHDCRWGSWFFS